MTNFLNQYYWGNSVLAYFMALGVFIVGIVAARVFYKIVLKRLKKWAEKTDTSIDDFLIKLLIKVGAPLLYVGAIYLSTQTLIIAVSTQAIIGGMGLVFLVFSVAKTVSMLIGYVIDLYLIKSSRRDLMAKSVSGVVKVLQVLVWGGALIFLLDNFGFKVSTVVAGLGIGGIAIGLAAQAVLQDVFSYFSILVDKPFEIGDFIIVGEHLGTVEYIGMKTTRIRSLGGEQLIFSNTSLTDSTVRNYKRMAQRRVVFSVGVTYQTTPEQLAKIPPVIENIVKEIDETRFDRAHFASFGDFSLNFEIVFYVLSGDYNKYMDTQQAINLKITQEFAKMKVEFAYPTQTVFMAK